MTYTPASLRAFSDDVAATFNAGEIKAPVHLAGGNEEELIDIFAQINPEDWCLCSWRSHYHCLLKGVPAEEVKAAIVAGRSISLCFPEYRVLSSGIVGGVCPIAVGLGWSIKKGGGSERVIVFVGDMTAETGIFHECAKYADAHQLPVIFVIESNGMSGGTDTKQAWGELCRPVSKRDPWRQVKLEIWKPTESAYPPSHWRGWERPGIANVVGYAYEMTKPHVGVGKWVSM